MSTLRRRKPVAWAMHIALMPMLAAAVVGYLGSLLWTIYISMTASRMLPSTKWVGLEQYKKLFASERWIISLENWALYAVLAITLTMLIGISLAILMDQKIRMEDGLRSVFLYPYAMSFVVTGLVWQWIFNPDLGLEHAMQHAGWVGFKLDWLVSQDKVMYCIVVAAVWQASGLVMAIMLAGLRSVDPEIWKAARLDGIPAWRTYVHIVLPMLKGALATAFILQAIATIKVYDTVNAMTQGGPGLASEVPAKFIMDNLFQRASIGIASAASVVMILTVVALLVPYYFLRRQRSSKGG